jgi:hypothetical protein
MKRCEYCGKENKDAGVNCAGCGTSLETPPPRSQSSIAAMDIARPVHVEVAIGLLALSSALGILRVSSHGNLHYRDYISLGIYVWSFAFMWIIFQGRNWARLLCLLVTGIAVVGFFSPARIHWLLGRPLLEIGWFCFQSWLCPAAIILLFLPSSNAWFRNSKAK